LEKGLMSAASTFSPMHFSEIPEGMEVGECICCKRPLFDLSQPLDDQIILARQASETNMQAHHLFCVRTHSHPSEKASKNPMILPQPISVLNHLRNLVLIHDTKLLQHYLSTTKIIPNVIQKSVYGKKAPWIRTRRSRR
jgi:hypothetical protein